MIALTRQGGPLCRRRWIVVPNVYWGWGLSYEADLIAISKTGRVTEVEIKVSKSDLVADFLKYKWKKGLDERINKFFYAVPEKLKQFALENIPETAGLYSVKEKKEHSFSLPTAEIVRPATAIKQSKKPSESDINNLSRLGVMRYWDLLIKEA